MHFSGSSRGFVETLAAGNAGEQLLGASGEGGEDQMSRGHASCRVSGGLRQVGSERRPPGEGGAHFRGSTFSEGSLHFPRLSQCFTCGCQSLRR